MHRVIIGTAGHIDHGKTRLLEALTGIDCDRWAEEKARGITIDLGFAHLQEDDLQVGFIDVPGHERFLHNALAGLGGIRLVLLVVAADEGVKPQTREHLAICSLLGIEHAIVVLTKRDLVESDLLELAELEVGELLEGTPFAEAPIMAVSSVSGEGLDELRQALLERAREVAVLGGGDEPLRLPIDRAFHLRGLGVVVTGTLVSGSVATGDSPTVLPEAVAGRVRGVQVHGESRPRAIAGERTALQVAGVELAQLGRGAQLVTPECFAPGRLLCVRFTLLADAPEPLGSSTPVRFHLYSNEVLGRLRPLEPATLEPGESGVVEIRLRDPVVAVRGDRFIVRRPSPATTLGGGEILDPQWRRRRGKSLGSVLKELAARERLPLALWTFEAGEAGVAAAELAPRLGLRPEAVEERLAKLAESAGLLRVETGRGRRWISPEVCRRVVKKAGQELRRYFKEDRLARGMKKAELLGRVLPERAAPLGDTYLGFMVAAKALVVDGGLVNLPGRRAELTGEESKLSKAALLKVEASGLTPPSPAQIAMELNTKPQILEGVLRFLQERGKLVRLPSGLILSSKAIATLREELVSAGDDITVGDFKDRYGLSRKWAIPLLEHLDSIGVTRRVGDRRQIVRK